MFYKNTHLLKATLLLNPRYLPGFTFNKPRLQLRVQTAPGSHCHTYTSFKWPSMVGRLAKLSLKSLSRNKLGTAGRLGRACLAGAGLMLPLKAGNLGSGRGPTRDPGLWESSGAAQAWS